MNKLCRIAACPEEATLVAVEQYIVWFLCENHKSRAGDIFKTMYGINKYRIMTIDEFQVFEVLEI